MLVSESEIDQFVEMQTCVEQGGLRSCCKNAAHPSIIGEKSKISHHAKGEINFGTLKSDIVLAENGGRWCL